MRNKVCLAASSGGHLEEILNLKGLTKYYDLILLTAKTRYPIKTWVEKVYNIPQVNRKEILCLPKLICALFISLYLVIKEKPFVVISIGALATIPVCLVAKMFGVRVIYIESFARKKGMSKTGKFLCKFADVTIVQWEEMLEYCPNAVYGGMIY